jgi:hypothetical protein
MIINDFNIFCAQKLNASIRLNENLFFNSETNFAFTINFQRDYLEEPNFHLNNKIGFKVQNIEDVFNIIKELNANKLNTKEFLISEYNNKISKIDKSLPFFLILGFPTNIKTY